MERVSDEWLAHEIEEVLYPRDVKSALQELQMRRMADRNHCVDAENCGYSEWQLKPCPFCGGEAKIFVFQDVGICVKCMNLHCRCQTESIVDLDLNSCKKYNALEYVVKTWNRRANDEGDNRH